MKRIIVSLMLAGLVTGCGATIEPTTKDEPVEVAVEQPTVREEMADWWKANRTDWLAMQQRLSAVDLSGAVEIMNRIEPMPDRGAQVLWMRFQRDLNSAKTAYDMGDIVTATHYVEQALPHMTELGKYIESLA